MAFKTPEQYEQEDNLLVSVWGLAKTGKTTFYTGTNKAVRGWPGPLYVINTDQGLLENLWTPDRKWRVDPRLEGQVYICDIVPRRSVPTTAEKKSAYTTAMADIDTALDAIKKEKRGTLVIDTMTKFWQLMSDVLVAEEASKTRSGEVQRFMYGVPNRVLTNLVLTAKGVGANLVLVHHAKEVFDAAGKPTGTYVPQDNNLIDQLVQVEIYQRAQDFLSADGKSTVTRHYGKYTFNRFNESVRQQEFENLDYAMLYEECFGKEPKD